MKEYKIIRGVGVEILKELMDHKDMSVTPATMIRSKNLPAP
ncbi:MAG: hypothetical protein ACYC1D_01205 [Acidimicrobiales bacterium]